MPTLEISHAGAIIFSWLFMAGIGFLFGLLYSARIFREHK